MVSARVHIQPAVKSGRLEQLNRRAGLDRLPLDAVPFTAIGAAIIGPPGPTQ